MYRNDHKERYTTLPISIFDTESENGNPKYGSWPLNERDGDLCRYFVRHQHETLEILYNMEGILHIELENDTLAMAAGDLLIVNPFVHHAGDFRISERPNRYRCLQLELGYFIPAVQNRLREIMICLLNGTGHFCEYIPASHPESGVLAEILNRIYQRRSISGDDAENDCLLMADVYALLGHLIRSFYADSPEEQVQRRDLHFIRSVAEYLEHHYTESLTTSVISGALSYNVSHFCHLFRANFNNSFARYLSEYRIVRSLYYYRDSSLHISEIAAAVGFGDYGYFAQEFKKYTGITPTAFFIGRGK
jgi:AraC-like DNA-binding protein